MGCCMTTPNPQGSQQPIVSQDLRRPEHNSRPSDEPQRQRRESNAREQQRQARSGQRQGHSQNTTGLRITYLQNPNVEIIKHDKTKGEGVQKTLAFDTPLPESELNNWRNVFWETRTSGSKEVWAALKNACEADHETAQTIVQLTGLQLPQDSLTTAIDASGVYYRVPICCIQEPDSYNVDAALDALKAKKAPQEKMIKIKVKNLKVGEKEVVVSNLASILMVKQSYCSQIDDAIKADLGIAGETNVRFFCLGKELKDDLYVYSYEMFDNIVVQVTIRK